MVLELPGWVGWPAAIAISRLSLHCNRFGVRSVVMASPLSILQLYCIASQFVHWSSASPRPRWLANTFLVVGAAPRVLAGMTVSIDQPDYAMLVYATVYQHYSYRGNCAPTARIESALSLVTATVTSRPQTPRSPLLDLHTTVIPEGCFLLVARPQPPRGTLPPHTHQTQAPTNRRGYRHDPHILTRHNEPPNACRSSPHFITKPWLSAYQSAKTTRSDRSHDRRILIRRWHRHTGAQVRRSRLCASLVITRLPPNS
ncbi:hypothetical protein DE4576_05466 [Mycobacterium marinum]|nr:hypothetical protein DE4576_05466 [Mycobacterium marinum]